MAKSWKFLLLVLSVITGIWFYLEYKRKKQLKKEEDEAKAKKLKEEGDALAAYYEELLPTVKDAHQEFLGLTSLQTGYFTNLQEQNWKNKYLDLNQKITSHPLLPALLDSVSEKLVTDFSYSFRNAKAIRATFNNNFTEHELQQYSSLFDNIEGRRLDLQQRTAIITDEDNNLIIAGAGSGKTTTVVGKVRYILHRYPVAPEEVLLISFTNKSAQTLAGRIENAQIKARTFHKFAKDVIAAVEGMQPSLYDQAQFKLFVKKCFSALLKQPDYINEVTTYFNGYLKAPRSQFDFDNQGDYIQYIKDQHFRPYKQVLNDATGRQTYRQEIVKSVEECKVANFLLFNNLEYQYERRYEFDTADENYGQYKPDFTIIQNGRKVYIEHLAINRSGDVPTFFASPRS